MHERKKCLTIILGSFIAGASISYTHANDRTANLKVCFTPGEPCTDRIIKTIKEAKSEILVQSYSFTSQPIADALIAAHEKGIKIVCIFDHSQRDAITPRKLQSAGLQVLIDKPAGIAHNKVMVLDRKTVITGSFNFTKAAQFRNVENSIIIEDKSIADKYFQKWQERAKVSKPIGGNKLIEGNKPMELAPTPQRPAKRPRFDIA